MTLGFGDATNQDQDGPGIMGPPICSSFSPDGLLVALAHAGKVSLWQIKGDEPADYAGTWERDAFPEDDPQEVEAMLFNPNPELEFVMATYRSKGAEEGELVLYDYSRMDLAEVRAVEAEPYALSATPDGQTLATGDRRGNIQIWDFESLTQLYVIKYNSFAVRELAFSHNGKRLLDPRQTHSVVWEPAVLVRNHYGDDDTSTSGTSVALPQPTVVPNLEDPREITATALHPGISVAFVGKEDGGVRLYDLTGGRKIQDLVALQSGRTRSACSFGVWNGEGRLPGPAAVGPDGGPAPPRVRGQIPAGRKHFFIPHEKYLGGNDNVQARVGNKGEVIISRRGELAVIWGGIGKSTG